MKQIFYFVMAMMVLAMPATASAKEESHPTKKEQKGAEKSAKNSVKQLKKAKWEFQISGDPEIVLYNHLIKLADYGGQAQEKIAEANNMKSISLGTTKARQDAIQGYASEQKMAIKGRIESSGIIADEEQMENLVSAFEGRVAAEINHDMVHSFTIFRKNKDGKYDVRVYYLIDEVASKKARIRALEADVELQKVALQLGKTISDFVNEE